MPTDKDSQPLQRAHESRTARALAWLAPSENPAGAVFGLITIGVLLAAESTRHESYPEIVGTSLIALLLYWFAHTYAHLLGRRLELGERLTASALRHSLIHNWAIVTGAGIPLIAVLACWLAEASPATAVLTALWTSAALLVVIELAAGIRAKAGPRELVIEGCVGAAMGIGVLALRVILA